MAWAWRSPFKKNKGVPAGTPPVTGLTGFCNSITEHIIHQNDGFVNLLVYFLCSVIVYAAKSNSIQ